MPLRRLNLETADGQFTPSSTITTVTPTGSSSDENNHKAFQSNYFHEQVASQNVEDMPRVDPPPHILGRPTEQAVAALAMHSSLARRLLQNMMSSGRRKSGGGEPNSLAESAPQNKTGTSREPSVTFSLQNEQIAFDEETSERSQVPQDRSQIRRTTSTPRNGGSVNGDAPPIGFHPPLRRNSRNSAHMRGSVSNISELAAGPLVMYNPHDPFMMPPPPMLSRAPSMSQMWFPQPPPPPMHQFAPYYYPSPFTAPMPPPLDPKAMRKAMKQAQKLEKKRRLEADIAFDRVGLGFYCCDGIAKLLWAIILVTLVGFVAALLLALFVL